MQKSKGKKPDKEIAKKIAQPNTSKKRQRYVSIGNVKRFEGKGWKVVGKPKALSDLLLMEK